MGLIKLRKKISLGSIRPRTMAEDTSLEQREAPPQFPFQPSTLPQGSKAPPLVVRPTLLLSVRPLSHLGQCYVSVTSHFISFISKWRKGRSWSLLPSGGIKVCFKREIKRGVFVFFVLARVSTGHYTTTTVEQTLVWVSTH